MTYPPRQPDDEPRSQPFEPVSYDLAPEYGTPPPANNPPPYGNDPRQGGTAGYPPASGYPTSGQPAPGYPTSGQPGPGYPTSGQPASGYPVSGQPDPYGQPPQSYPHPQPGYPQPAYQGPQPGYQTPQPTYPGPVYNPTPPVPPKKGKGLKITFSIIGAVFLICAIAACVFLYPVFSEGSAHVSAPATLPGDLKKDDSAEMQKVVDEMESDLRNDVGSVDEVAAGIYSSGDPQKLVIIVAATSTILFPDSELDDAFKGFNDSSNAGLTTQTEYDAGKFGGKLKCSTGTSDEVKMTLCAWADHGSVGIGVFINRDSAESAAMFVQIREAVQTRA